MFNTHHGLLDTYVNGSLRSMSKIVYLHGFNSSPASFKAQQLARLMQAIGLPEAALIPQLDNDPAKATANLEQLIKGLERPLLVGSSLGGFYATYFAERFNLEAVLINPAVAPHRLFKDRLGVQVNYHTGQQWQLTQAHVDALAALEVPAPTAGQRIEVWLQTGDETLDYRHAQQYYQGCLLDIEQGGDHSYQGFAQKLGRILKRAGICEQAWRDFDFLTLD